MKREIKYPYIMLDSEGIVQNIAMFDDYEAANQITRACYGEGAYATAYNYAVAVGDKHIDGVFYVVNEDGSLTVADYIPNDEDNINMLTAKSAELADSEDLTLDLLADQEYRLSLIELGIL